MYQPLCYSFNIQNFFIWRAASQNGHKFCKPVGSLSNYQVINHRIDSTLYSFLPFCNMIITNFAIFFKLIRAKYKTKHGSSESTSQALSKSATKGSVMLITVSIMFIILTGPVVIAYAISVSPDPILNAVFIIMQYTNHSINGLLYCIVGSKFRKELVKTLGCGGKNRIKDSRSTNASQT